MLIIRFSQEHSTLHPLLDFDKKSPYYEATLSLEEALVNILMRVIEGHDPGKNECVTVNLENGTYIRDNG